MLKKNSVGSLFMEMYSDHQEKACCCLSSWDPELSCIACLVSHWSSRVLDSFLQPTEELWWHVLWFCSSVWEHQQDILPREYISHLEERNGKAMFCWHPCSVLALSSATSSSWTWFSGTKAHRLPYHSSLWLLSSLYGSESRSPSHLSEHILDSANPQLSNPSEPIRFPDKFRISQFILNPFPASSWAVFSPLVASSFNSSSFSTAFGQARFTTCTDFFSLSLWFWSSHARKQQFCSATFIYVLRITIGGGEVFLLVVSQHFTLPFTVFIISSLSLTSKTLLPHSYTLDILVLWCSASFCWQEQLDSLHATGLSGRFIVLWKWIDSSAVEILVDIYSELWFYLCGLSIRRLQTHREKIITVWQEK